MVVDVVPHEGGHEAVEMVEVIRYPQLDWVPDTTGHCREVLGPQQVSHVVRTALVLFMKEILHLNDRDISPIN